MSPRMMWLAVHVLPTLYALANVRNGLYDEADAYLKAAEAARASAYERLWEARNALDKLVELLKGAGFSQQDLNRMAVGPHAPADTTNTTGLLDSEVPL